MRGLYGMICLLLVGLVAGMAIFIGDNEMHAARWNNRVEKIEYMETLNQDLLRSQEYSFMLMEATRMLANENGILCERDAKTVQQVAVFDEENRLLKSSLVEATGKIEEMLVDLNELIDENEALRYKNKVLEQSLEVLTTAREKAADLGDEMAAAVSAVPTLNTIVNIINTIL